MSLANPPHTGVLLVNLGTPASTSTADVRRYLREFLSDPFVVDIHPVARWLLLNLVILPFRPRKSAAAYREIWTEEGSPLLVHGRRLELALRDALGPGFRVELAMRYGQPDLASALAALEGAGVARIVAVPLFPQYSRATTGSVLARVEALRATGGPRPPLHWLDEFYAAPGFIDALVSQDAASLEDFGADHLLVSFHGLPERQVRSADPSGTHCLASESCCDRIIDANARCYRAQCFATARAYAAALEVPEREYSVAFQSRLGRDPWIGPATDHRLSELAQSGVRRLAVACPSFVADCLETLEEIGIRARDQWREAGGEALLLLPCLNANPRWVDVLAGWIRAVEGR